MVSLAAEEGGLVEIAEVPVSFKSGGFAESLAVDMVKCGYDEDGAATKIV